jgi:Tfp pilus assembly protein PilV
LLLGESLGEAAMRAFFVFVVLVVLGVAAYAAETITYTYDARGRLKQVAHSGTPPVNNGVNTTYTYDKADNRTNKTTTGSPNPGPP